MDRLIFPIVTRNYFHAAAWLTQSAGLFAAEDLIVDLDYQDKGSDEPAELVRQGRAQVGTLGVEHLLKDRESGGRLVAIGGSINGLPFSLIAQPSIRKISDLRGKTVGVSSLNFGTSGMLTRHLSAHGLHPGDYKLLAMGPIEKRWTMLRSGEIDAGLQGAPHNYMAIDAGFSDLGTLAATYPQFQFSCFFTDARWAEKNRGIVVRYLRALLHGVELFHADKEQAGTIAAEKTGCARNYVDRAWDDYVAQKIYPLDGEVNMAGVQTAIDMSAEVRGVATRAAARAEDYVDRSYLIEAQRTLSR